MGHKQVRRHLGVARHVGQDREGDGHDENAADGQAIQTVREIDGVAGAHHHQPDPRNQQDAHVWSEILKEGHRQLARVGAAKTEMQDEEGHQQRDAREQRHLLPAAQPQVLLLEELLGIVEGAHNAEAQQRQECDPDGTTLELAPEQRREQDHTENEDAPHGGRAGLHLVMLRAFLANVLPHLQARERADHQRPQQQG